MGGGSCTDDHRPAVSPAPSPTADERVAEIEERHTRGEMRKWYVNGTEQELYFCSACHAKWPCDIPYLIALYREQREKLDKVREKNTLLNRRCQQAEAALPAWQALVDQSGKVWKGGNFGRMLLAWGIGKANEENAALKQALREHGVHLGGCLAGEFSNTACKCGLAALVDTQAKEEGK